jgi:AraC-like DNA-binding protein
VAAAEAPPPHAAECLRRKRAVVELLRARLRDLDIQGVVAAHPGLPDIGAFLRLGDLPRRDALARRRAEGVAMDLIAHVREGTGESICIGISDFCGTHARFPQAAQESALALECTFRTGRGTYAVFERPRAQARVERQDMTKAHFTAALSAVNKFDKDACARAIAGLVEALRKSEITPFGVRMHLAGFASRVADYYLAAGLDRDALDAAVYGAHERLMSCAFIDDMTGVLRAFCEAVMGLHRDASLSAAARFRQYVDDCIDKYSPDYAFNLNRAAALSNYSPSYFSRLFTRVYGASFSGYLADYRVERAKRLLASHALSLQDVAAGTGFRSTSYFCSVFKKKTGVSPRQYHLAARGGDGG